MLGTSVASSNLSYYMQFQKSCCRKWLLKVRTSATTKSQNVPL
uniref:Uncharacterized protein n=1 Tax=Citrus limon TaxID=2708 RepID=A0A1S8ACC2_CITLI